MDAVLSMSISPFGAMDILPEQLCGIMGVTVKGQKVSASGLKPRSRGFGREFYERNDDSP